MEVGNRVEAEKGECSVRCIITVGARVRLRWEVRTRLLDGEVGVAPRYGEKIK